MSIIGPVLQPPRSFSWVAHRSGHRKAAQEYGCSREREADTISNEKEVVRGLSAQSEEPSRWIEEI